MVSPGIPAGHRGMPGHPLESRGLSRPIPSERTEFSTIPRGLPGNNARYSGDNPCESLWKPWDSARYYENPGEVLYEPHQKNIIPVIFISANLPFFRPDIAILTALR